MPGNQAPDQVVLAVLILYLDNRLYCVFGD